MAQHNQKQERAVKSILWGEAKTGALALTVVPLQQLEDSPQDEGRVETGFCEGQNHNHGQFFTLTVIQGEE